MTKKQKYFRKQKLIGLIVVLGMIFVAFVDNDITIPILGIPTGLYCMFTKEMVITDEYFFEEEERSQQ